MSETLRVLVVEDHDALREATVSFLRQEGFDATGVACAEEVDDLPEATSADAYVIDLQLPGEDGLSLALRLRHARPDAPIIITTARTHLNDRVKGYEAGADIYMGKPVEPEELRAALVALTHRRKAAQTESAGLRLDQRQLLLIGVAGQSRLTQAEARLLLALASAKDQTLERWQVAVQLNPDNEDMSADNLQNRLSQLRKKMTACGVEGEGIRAVRRVGYRLCVPLKTGPT